MPSSTILDIIAIRETGPDVFESVHPPEQMGNTMPIAYGGCTVSLACMAAHAGIPDTHRIYSMNGNYLGPASLDHTLTARCKTVRRTRTFITRLVTISQTQSNGTERDCLVVLCDFHAIEPATLLTFSKPKPSHMSTPPATLPTMPELVDSLERAGAVGKRTAKFCLATFDLCLRSFDVRFVPDGMTATTLSGFAKHLPKPQMEALPMSERWSVDWFRTRVPVEGPAANAAALAFMLDGALAFQPLIHAGMALNDASAASSLDFALRFFVNDVNVNDWVGRELKCLAGGAGRTYSESQVWDERGRMVASMTQTCILRPVKDAKL